MGISKTNYTIEKMIIIKNSSISENFFNFSFTRIPLVKNMTYIVVKTKKSNIKDKLGN